MSIFLCCYIVCIITLNDCKIFHSLYYCWIFRLLIFFSFAQFSWVNKCKVFLPHSLTSVAQSCPTLCDPMNRSMPGLPVCPSPSPGVYPNSCPSSRWCHPAISSSVVPFSSCPPSFPTSGSFQMTQLFALGGQSIGVSTSASVLPMNIQDWFSLG